MCRLAYKAYSINMALISYQIKKTYTYIYIYIYVII